MSQSPVDDFSPVATARYQQGWKALNRLLHESRSFSGRERHCMFLNTGGSPAGEGQFANISAVSGVDFAEDGRAVALCDWDFDGRLDLWLTNRTAPRLRFLRNQNDAAGQFLALRLAGDGVRVNRDAVGARVTLMLSDGPDGPRPPMIRTLHAGDAFLSQSSSWLHFTWGDDAEIERVVIRWPGGESQRLDGLTADRRYDVVYGGGQPTAWTPPKGRAPLESSPPEIAPMDPQARIVLPTRLELPSLTTHQHSQPLDERLDGPTLLNLWSASCAPCIRELREFAEHADRLKRSGLDIVAINLDSLETGGADGDLPISKIDFPFRSEQATLELVRSLDVFQRAIFDRWEDLAVPTSFLIDRRGRVAAIYRGTVSVEQLVDDLHLLDASPEQLRNLATPLAGQWLSTPPPTDPLRVTSQFIDANMVGQGAAYLERYAKSESAAELGGRNLGDVFHIMALLLRDQGQLEEARDAFHKALRYNPDDIRVRNDLANMLARQGRLAPAAAQLERALEAAPDDVNTLRKVALLRMARHDLPAAIDAFEQVVAAQPGDVAAQYNLANAYRATGRLPEALRMYERILEIEPDMFPAANNLAWIRATHPSAEIRNGPEAVRLAERLCEKTDSRHAGYLDTLAAAYAEAGQFDRATETLRKAIDLAEKQDDEQAADDMRRRLKLFAAKRPYRDASS